MKNYRDAAKVSAAKKMKCYASGGRVSEDISDPGSLPVVAGGEPDGDEGMSVDGGRAKPRLDKGGKKPAVNVNVVVMGGKDKAPVPPPAPMPAMANPMPPPPMPPMGAPPPGIPMRKNGGRVMKAVGGPVASGQTVGTKGEAQARSIGRKAGGRVMAKGEGAGGGLGRLEKIKDYGAKAGKPAKGS